MKCPNCLIINLVKANHPRTIKVAFDGEKTQFRSWYCQECDTLWEFDEKEDN